jgi:hypothetical protein
LGRLIVIEYVVEGENSESQFKHEIKFQVIWDRTEIFRETRISAYMDISIPRFLPNLSQEYVD